MLIGMPGCGKSTIGKRLSQKLGRDFFDSDDVIEQKSQMSIPDIFAEFGEEEFRKRETEALKELSEKENIIISTGGGAVEREVNMTELGKNGVIVFIDRSLENIFSDIDISGRPLLADKIERLSELYARRLPLYTKYYTVRTENNKSIDETIEKIICEVEKL